MIYQNSIMNALETTISSNSNIVANSFTVVLNALYNMDPNLTPWIGIYNNNINVENWTINTAYPFKVNYSPVIYIQTQIYDFNDVSLKNAHTTLNTYLDYVTSALKENRTLNNNVDMLNSMSIEPFGTEIQEDNAILTYELILQYEKRLR